MSYLESFLIPITSALLAQVFIQVGKILLIRRGHNDQLEESKRQTAYLRLLNRNLEGFHIFTSLNSNPMLLGCDISKYQGTVDWDALSAATDFAIIRSSWGNGGVDSQFDRNRSEARRTGILHGFYHYAYPNQNSPEAEARWFLETVGELREGELLALDFEESYPDPVSWCLRFLDTVKAERSGYKPLLYINLNTARSHNWEPVIDGDYGLWLAYWNYDYTSNAASTQWPFIAMRQYSNREPIAGLTIDANVFFGDRGALYNYGIQFPHLSPPEAVTVPVEPDPTTEPVVVPVEVTHTEPVPDPTPTNIPIVKPITFDLSPYGWNKGVKEFFLSLVKTAVAAVAVLVVAKLESYDITAHVSANFAIYALAGIGVARALLTSILVWTKSVPSA